MAVDAHFLRSLIADELMTLSDARVVAHVMKLLVAPHSVLRSWDYGTRGRQYPCWIVLDDPAHSFSAIAFCEFGFGPKCPWGLISSGDAPSDMHMGMDSGWFPSFLDAYFDSWAATELPIWQIMKEEPDRTLVPLSGEGTWGGTWDRINELRSADPSGRYDCRHGITYGGKPVTCAS
ncbi:MULTISPECIES: hypothetical protein [unclassified Bradyrhizobium]